MNIRSFVSATRVLATLALASLSLSSPTSAQLLLSEDFETVSPTHLPVGWQSPVTSGTMWYIGLSWWGACGNTQVPGSPRQMLCNDGYNVNPCTISPGSVALTTPLLSVGASRAVTIEFAHHISIGPNDQAEVILRGPGASSPAPLVLASVGQGLTPGGIDTWNKAEILVSPQVLYPYLQASDGQFLIDFVLTVGTGGNSSGFSIDDVIINGIVPPPEVYCDGSVSCPCNLVSPPGQGCLNSSAGYTSGATLGWSGTASVANDTFSLVGSGMPADVWCQFFHSTTPESGIVFWPGGGGGLLCLVPALNRLETVQTNAQGACSTTIDVAALSGVMIGQSAYYQAYYREPMPFCTGSSNTTNGLKVYWLLP